MEFYLSPSENSCPGYTTFTKSRELQRKNTYYRVICVYSARRVTNHHDEEHSRKLQIYLMHLVCVGCLALVSWELKEVLLLSL